MQVVCPYCEKPLEVTVRKPGGGSMFVTGREWLGRIIRPRRLDHTVSDIGQPIVNVTQPAAPAASLNPGEEMRRTLDEQHDIRPQARMGRQCSIYVTGFTSCIIVGFVGKEHAWIIVVASLAALYVLVAAAVFLRLNWDILWKGDKERLITRRRNPEQPETEQRPWHVKGEYQEGRKTLYDEFELTDAPAWHKFCKAVYFDGRNFSGQESKRHKVPPSDWDTVSGQWTKRGWLVLKKRRGTPELHGAGHAWVRAYATTPPQAKAR